MEKITYIKWQKDMRDYTLFIKGAFYKGEYDVWISCKEGCPGGLWDTRWSERVICKTVRAINNRIKGYGLSVTAEELEGKEATETEKKGAGTMTKKAEVINVTFNEDKNGAVVTYSTGTVKPYKNIINLPKTALDWLEKQEKAMEAEAKQAETEEAETETMTEAAEEATEEAAQPETVYETQEEHEQRVRETAPEILAVAGIMAELKAKLEEEPEKAEKEPKEPQQQEAEQEPETIETEELEQKENKEAFENLPVIDTTTGETITENAAEIIGRNEAAKQKAEPETREAEGGIEEPEKSLLAAQEPGSVVVAEKISFEGYGAAEVVGFGVMLSFAFVWWIARGTIELFISALSMLIYRAWADREKTKESAIVAVKAALRAASLAAEHMGKVVRKMAANLPTVGSIKTISVIARVVMLAIGLLAII